VIQRSLQNPLATMILDGSIHDGQPVDVTVRDGKLQIAGQVFEEEAA
jgi:ATP-dependent Clp protease ATP-binding subunit ClpB